jgi:hypothetical protein
LKNRVLAFVTVLGLFVCSLTAYGLGVYKTFKTVIQISTGEARNDFALITLFDCLDSFLVATAIWLFPSVYTSFLSVRLKFPIGCSSET